MKEYPILFNGEMVKAILEGRKTQTRRVIKDLPSDFPNGIGCDVVIRKVGDFWCLPTSKGYKKSPYGGKGDLLWVRETWATQSLWDDTKPSELPLSEGVDNSKTFPLMYKADEAYPVYYSWRPSIHMPRWASRITLRVTDVRVERVQEISAIDAMWEGIEKAHHPINKKTIETSPESSTSQACVADFRKLWDSINAKRGFSWDVNPWVWVVEFERVMT